MQLFSSHIDFAHNYEMSIVHFSQNLPPPPLETSKIFIRAFSRFWYPSYAILLPLAAIKIVSKHKVVCAQNVMSDPRLLYKQYRFCENRRNCPMNLRQKSFYIPFQDVFKKSKMFLAKISDFPTTCTRETSQPPNPHPQTYNCHFLWAKSICEASQDRCRRVVYSLIFTHKLK